ncbi:hypothetical protein E0L36_22780 [Streptomyces sp. AJS327]|uniref:hypothetical protein n=1 Tax=Streptomyces sp. AJS327 TaxID=2545265 RepID=UPI0015DF1412|nr:hypothetical protein [Streptomyces sp. AJS327]MBA0053596.1 hypothetical protein [Streptomyces sp. AJS327]
MTRWSTRWRRQVAGLTVLAAVAAFLVGLCGTLLSGGAERSQGATAAVVSPGSAPVAGLQGASADTSPDGWAAARPTLAAPPDSGTTGSEYETGSEQTGPDPAAPATTGPDPAGPATTDPDPAGSEATPAELSGVSEPSEPSEPAGAMTRPATDGDDRLVRGDARDEGGAAPGCRAPGGEDDGSLPSVRGGGPAPGQLAEAGVPACAHAVWDAPNRGPTASRTSAIAPPTPVGLSVMRV